MSTLALSNALIQFTGQHNVQLSLQQMKSTFLGLPNATQCRELITRLRGLCFVDVADISAKAQEESANSLLRRLGAIIIHRQEEQMCRYRWFGKNKSVSYVKFGKSQSAMADARHGWAR